MNASGSTLHTTELIEALISAGTGDVTVGYADGDVATVERVETGPNGVVLVTGTDSLQAAMNDFVARLEAITDMPSKGGRQAVMDAVDQLIDEAQNWTTKSSPSAG
jgi:hypothetical protein